MTIIVYIALMLVPVVVGYSTGPAPSACDDMIPQHGRSQQQGSAPFTISFPAGKTTYSDNEQIQVTLAGTGEKQFKGFMIQARPAANTYKTYGKILISPSGTGNKCSGKGAGKDVALTHTNANLKSSVNFTWEAPSSDVGNIVFVFTVVETKAVFWVKGTSSVLSYKANQDPPADGTTKQTTKKDTDTVTDKVTSPTTKKVTDAVTDAPTSPTQQADLINRDPECEMTKSCFPDSFKCSTNCDFLISWRVTGEQDVEFTLQRKTVSNNYWIGIGFSDNPKMGNDSVVACISNNGQVNIETSMNDGYSNKPLDNKTFGVTLLRGSYTNGILSCSFTRKINATLAGASQSMDEKFFDLNTEWFLLVAHGSADAGAKNKHSAMPKTSLEKLDFLTVNTDRVTTPATTDTGVVKKDIRCGDSLGCYHDCGSGGNCGFLLTWKEIEDNVLLTLTCKQPGNNVYCAIGMSKDKEMGDDSVFECVSSGQVSAYVSYNDGKNNYRLSQDQFGISDIVATYEDGILRCEFKRMKTAALAQGNATRKKRAREPSSSTFFDMNDNFYLLSAYGSAVAGFINQHQKIPKVSSEVADFQEFMDIGASTEANIFVIVHGVLMMFAWLFFARLGMFIAGQYKNVWPEGMEWCGQKRWFILHRSLMVTVFLVTAASFIVIFVHEGGYSEIIGSNFQKSHPIVGIVVMCLVTLNPIMALFRPHPGTPKRPYFNFAHISVGIVAYVCGVVNIFSGFEQQSANVPFEAKIVVWVYLGWVGVIELMSYIYDCQNKKASKSEMYEMKNTAGNEPGGPRQKVSLVKIGLLCLHAVGMLALVIAAAVIVQRGKTEDHDH